MNVMKRLWLEEEGQGMTEYGLIIALIAVAVIVALTTMGEKLQEIFGRISGSLNANPS